MNFDSKKFFRDRHPGSSTAQPHHVDRTDTASLRSFAGYNRRLSNDSGRPMFDDNASIAESIITPLPEPRLPDLDLPKSELDLTFTFESIISEAIGKPPASEDTKVQKRASNVLKLSQENEKLKEELRAMNARIEAAERKQQELRSRVTQGQPAQTTAS